MKQVLLLLAILLPAVSVRAQPRIDSMKIVTESSVLQVYGAFSSQGAVTVDDVLLPITSWTDSLIVCEIQDTGRGSAGAVVVASQGLDSEPKNITLWEGSWSQDYVERHSRDLGNSQELQYRVRLDLHDAILRSQRYLKFALDSSSTARVTRYADAQYTPEFGYNTSWRIDSRSRACEQDTCESGFKASSTLDIKDHALYFGVSDIKGVSERISWTDNTGGHERINLLTYPGFSFHVRLDDSFVPIRLDTGWLPFGNDRTQVSQHAAGKVYFLPPDSIIALASIAILKAPFIAAFGVIIGWQPQENMVDYEFQLAKDDAFLDPETLTVVLDTFIALPLSSSGTYYARVRGRNRFGNAAWSATKQFEFRTSNVRRETAQSDLTFSEARLYNNSDKALSCKIFDLLGREQGGAMIQPNTSAYVGNLTRPMFVVIQGEPPSTILIP